MKSVYKYFAMIAAGSLLCINAFADPADFTHTTNNGAITITGYLGAGGDITIPGTINGLPVAAITNSAFINKTSITGVTIPDSITSIGYKAFNGAGLTNIVVPASVTNYNNDGAGFGYAFGYNPLRTATVNGILIGNNMFQGCAQLTNVIFNGTSTTIPIYTFLYCSALTTVQIPESVTSIETSAFMLSGITNIYIPNGVTNIGVSAFESCANLTGVYFRGNAPSFTSPIFANANSSTIYRMPEASGWPTVPTTWAGRPTALWLTLTGGSVTSSTNLQVVITANTPAGQTFERWIGDTQHVNSVTSSVAMVTLPLQPIGLTATYNYIYYGLTVENGSGDGSYTNGTVVAVTADAAADGFVFSGWTTDPAETTNGLADQSASSTTFTMPGTNVILIANHWATNSYADASRPDDSGDGTSWATAKQTIQAAVNVVAANGTVWVTNGTYSTGSAMTPDGTLPNRVAATNAITIRSVNGPEETIIQGQGPIGTNAVRGVYLSGNAQLIGFTVENGATYNIEDQLDGKGGGIYGAGCCVSNCVIKNNSAKGAAGGIYIDQGTLVCDCIIKDNQTEYRGGGAFIYHSGTMENCLIANNTATNKAGGVCVDWGSKGAYINNCTIAGNSAPADGGLGSIVNGATVRNSIIWGNINGNWSDGSYTCCATTPLPSGTGNIASDPLFADAAYRLSAGSPCINAGDNSYAPAGTDLDGNPRIAGGVVDMGAYEQQDAGTDVDGDGMADWWEMDYFGSRYLSEPNTTCSNGVNTILEAYIAGLDPNDPQSLFLTSGVYPQTSGNILQWPCVSGRVYSVYFSTNLLSGFQCLESNIPWTQGGFTNSTDEPCGYYKLDVRLEN